MFSGIRLYLMIAAGAALVGLAFYGKSVLKKANERDAAVSTLAAERHNHAVEISHVKEEAAAALAAIAANLKKAEVSSNAYQKDLAVVARERDAALHVRMCYAKPAASTTSPTTPGPDAATTGHLSEAPAGDLVEGPDVGNDLLNYAIDAESNKLQLERLQEWIRNR